MKKQMKSKSITLLSGIIEGEDSWRILIRLYSSGSFKNKGQIAIEPQRATSDAKRRELESHKISFWHEGCVWHHVNDRDVVATPKQIHTISARHSLNHRMLEGVLG